MTERTIRIAATYKGGIMITPRSKRLGSTEYARGPRKQIAAADRIARRIADLESDRWKPRKETAP